MTSTTVVDGRRRRSPRRPRRTRRDLPTRRGPCHAATVGDHLPPRGVLDRVMARAERVEVADAGAATAGPVDDVIELAPVGGGAAPREGARAVGPAGESRDRGRRAVATPVDGEHHAGDRMGEDAHPLRRGADEPSRRLEIDRAGAVDLGLAEGVVVGRDGERGHRHEHRRPDAAHRVGQRIGLAVDEQVARDVGTQLTAGAGVVRIAFQFLRHGRRPVECGLRVDGGQEGAEHGHAVALGLDPDRAIVGGPRVALLERRRVRPSHEPVDEPPETGERTIGRRHRLGDHGVRSLRWQLGDRSNQPRRMPIPDAPGPHRIQHHGMTAEHELRRLDERGSPGLGHPQRQRDLGPRGTLGDLGRSRRAPRRRERTGGRRGAAGTVSVGDRSATGFDRDVAALVGLQRCLLHRGDGAIPSCRRRRERRIRGDQLLEVPLEIALRVEREHLGVGVPRHQTVDEVELVSEDRAGHDLILPENQREFRSSWNLSAERPPLPFRARCRCDGPPRASWRPRSIPPSTPPRRPWRPWPPRRPTSRATRARG